MHTDEFLNCSRLSGAKNPAARTFQDFFAMPRWADTALAALQFIGRLQFRFFQ
jgi:hypothetical protein